MDSVEAWQQPLPYPWHRSSHTVSRLVRSRNQHTVIVLILIDLQPGFNAGVYAAQDNNASGEPASHSEGGIDHRSELLKRLIISGSSPVSASRETFRFSFLVRQPGRGGECESAGNITRRVIASRGQTRCGKK